MMAGQNQFNMRNMRNGMMPSDMRAAAMQNQMKSMQVSRGHKLELIH